MLSIAHASAAERSSGLMSTPSATGDALSTADKARAPHDRDALIKGFMEAKTPPSHEEIVARNREVTAAR
jgi:hypothetical protein